MATDILMEPFRVVIANDSTVLSILFKEHETIWSSNIKRALASLLQAHGDGPGAFVVEEQTIFGSCPTEYFVVNKSNVFEISKTYDMDRCNIYPGGIYLTRSNIPLNFCTAHKQEQAITSRIANYKLRKVEPYRYMLLEVDGTMRTNVRTFESYHPQFLYTKVQLKYVSHGAIGQALDVVQGMALLYSPMLFISPEAEATGGRSPKSKEKLVKRTADLLSTLADNLESVDSKLKEPYDETVSEIIRLMGTMDLDTLKLLFEEIDLGTSYRQETARNILLEIIPRTGTAATILLTRELIINQQVNPTTAVQLLISLPFYMSEPSYDLLKECEVFLSFGADRPDIKHAAVLSYATMIYNTFVAGKVTKDVVEKYVKIYFDMFLSELQQCYEGGVPRKLKQSSPFQTALSTSSRCCTCRRSEICSWRTWPSIWIRSSRPITPKTPTSGSWRCGPRCRRPTCVRTRSTRRTGPSFTPRAARCSCAWPPSPCCWFRTPRRAGCWVCTVSSRRRTTRT